MLYTWLELIYQGSQLLKIGYTQKCDVTLRHVWTLDLDFEVNLAKENGYFSSFLPAMASDHTPMKYYRAYSKNRCVHNLLDL